MPRPVIIAFIALIAGVGMADLLLYDAPWLAMASTRSFLVLFGPWCLCLVVAFCAYLAFRREAKSSIFTQHSWFPWLTALFWFSVGFGRYALVAEQQHSLWAVEGRPVNRGNPDEFDYVRWRWVSHPSREVVNDAAVEIRHRLTLRLEELGMEERSRSVLAAMTWGDRTALSRDVRDVFAEAGSSHLLALSGLHLGIIVGLFLQLMNGRLIRSRWRWPLGLATLLFIWSFTWLTGFSTSLVRAALMTSIFIVASLLNRFGYPVYTLLLTGMLMILWRPMFLFDIGAQLSFLSVLGILWLYQPLYEWCFMRWRFLVFRLERYHLLWPLTTMAVSVCAQVFTLPLVALYFHRVPMYGALVSVVLIPLAGCFIFGTGLMVALSAVWTAGATWLAAILSHLVLLMLGFMSWVSGWPGAVINDCWSRKAAPQVVVYHNRRCPALHVIASPSQSWLLMPEPEKADSGLSVIRRDFWQRRLTREPQLMERARGLSVVGFKAVMVNRNDRQESAEGERVPKVVDVLWMTRGFKGGSLGELPQEYCPRLLVLDASLAAWQRKALAHEAWRNHWRVYDIGVQGALQLGLSR